MLSTADIGMVLISTKVPPSTLVTRRPSSKTKLAPGSNPRSATEVNPTGPPWLVPLLATGILFEQLLKDQPINNSNSIPVANNGTSQGGPVGFTSVALRGLDPGASLVLLDGRRVTRVLGGTFVDINTIPMSAVESIEILKSGASAVYGADA